MWFYVSMVLFGFILFGIVLIVGCRHKNNRLVCVNKKWALKNEAGWVWDLERKEWIHPNGRSYDGCWLPLEERWKLVERIQRLLA